MRIYIYIYNYIYIYIHTYIHTYMQNKKTARSDRVKAYRLIAFRENLPEKNVAFPLDTCPLHRAPGTHMGLGY